MLFAYKRISSLGPSHDPIAYMAEALRYETQYFVPIQVRRSRKRSLKVVKAVIYAKLQDSTSRHIVPSFAAIISGGFEYLEAPGDKSGNY